MESLIKLTVKTPNQHIDDIQIDCDLQWTVRKLKEYLQDVYPSNPASGTQKLIYLGKLLQDHHLLKEVFGDWEAKTLHIVCSETSFNSTPMTTSSPTVSNSLPNSATSASASTPTTNSQQIDGVRYRGSTPQHNVTSMPMTSTSMPNMAQWYQSQFHQQQSNPWSQQYQMQMQQYYQHMQQWQMAMANGQWQNQGPLYSNPPSPQLTPNSPVAPQIQQQPQQVEPQPAQRGNRNPQMNAGPGGAIMADDEEENENPRNRDWLDWLYMSMRALMLMSIVYFYSTTSRFLMVSVLGFIIYIYQAGWFTPQRVQVPEPVEEEEEVQQENNERNGENENSNSSEHDSNNTTEQVQEINGAARPGIFKVLCTFFVSFMTSLVPTGPPALEQQ